MKITLKQILEELNKLALDMVEACVPDCTPEEHKSDCISMLARKVLTGIKERKQTTGKIENYDDVMMKR
jgi:hypothetical protein